MKSLLKTQILYPALANLMLFKTLIEVAPRSDVTMTSQKLIKNMFTVVHGVDLFILSTVITSR